MGLDVAVYCDCVERKRLLKAHPHPRQLYIARNGSPETRTKSATKIEAHDAWMEQSPCRHTEMTAAHCHLGSIGRIAEVREILRALPPSLPNLPVLLGKVLYSGSHTGDFLTAKQVANLRSELAHLEGFDFGATRIARSKIKDLLSICSDLARVSKTAAELGKPIAF